MNFPLKHLSISAVEITYAGNILPIPSGNCCGVRAAVDSTERQRRIKNVQHSWVDRHLTKPVHIAELVAVMRSLLERQSG